MAVCRSCSTRGEYVQPSHSRQFKFYLLDGDVGGTRTRIWGRRGEGMARGNSKNANANLTLKLRRWNGRPVGEQLETILSNNNNSNHNRVLRPLHRPTCVSRHLQLWTGGFCWAAKFYCPHALRGGNQRIRIRAKTLELAFSRSIVNFSSLTTFRNSLNIISFGMYTKYYISLALFVCPNMKPQSWRTNFDELDLSRSLVTDTRDPIYKISYDNLTIILR